MGTGVQQYPKPILIVQGGQWGSEAKGLICHKLTLNKRVDWAVRTGTVNAGHTVYYHDAPYAMQQLPVAWVKKDCQLVLGPGAYISPAILMREVEWIAGALDQSVEEVIGRIWIDGNCGIHTPEHSAKATHADRHHSIGTTGKGCSEAVVGKIMGRDQTPPPTFANWVDGKPGFWKLLEDRLCDTPILLNAAYDRGDQVMIEGTQGTLLDLHLGPYPYTTHKQTQAASWMAEAGLSCNLETEVWSVMRTFPIRVAGNSGPMPQELSWTKLARTMNDKGQKELVSEHALHRWEDALSLTRVRHFPEAPSSEPAYWPQDVREAHRVAASELHHLAYELLDPETRRELGHLFEFTTVTKKLRRIAGWNWDLAIRSLILNRPSYIALTFMNYLYPNMWGATKVSASDGWYRWADQVSETSCVEASSGPVGIVSFGPLIDHTHMMDELV